MTQTDSISSPTVTTVPRTTTVRHKKPAFNVAKIIDALPESATPAQQDSAVQANLPERIQVRSTRPDTLEIPGIPARKPFHLSDVAASYRQSFFDGNTFMHPEVSDARLGIQETPLPYQLRRDDGITAIILLIFMLLLVTFAKSKRFLFKQAKGMLYPPREYLSLFNDEPGDKQRNIAFMVCLTLLTISLQLMYFNKADAFENTFPARPYLILGMNLVIVVAYYVLKICFYRFVNWIFFDKTKNIRWQETYAFVYAMEGYLLFPLLLLTIYFDLNTFQALIYLAFIAIITRIVLLYETYIIFFPKIYGFLHLIVYFCALEITPLLMLCRVLAFINNDFVIKI